MATLKFCVAVLLLVVAVREGQASALPCENEIYCYGDILHTVQRAQIFKDSKTFVDMRMKYAPHIVKTNYHFLRNKTGPSLHPEEVQSFIDHNFDHPGSEFEPWDPEDWVAQPQFLGNINDSFYRQFASELNSFWKQLGRSMKKDVTNRGDMYSMIYVPNPVIVPGGRFMEFYYWDQYWILKGLLHCEMHQTVRGMLENFFVMVEHLGYIPNGGRIYYKRSQPPLLTPMVRDFVQETNNVTFALDHLTTLDKEFDFWMRDRIHVVNATGSDGKFKLYNVIRYNVELINPRPESYNPDYELVSSLSSLKEQNEVLMHIKTAAESGLDFSSRWFVPDDDMKISGNLLDTKARYVIPVDLNVLIYKNAITLSDWHKQAGNQVKAAEYQAIASEWEETINELFWNEQEGVWFDYVDYDKARGHKVAFYPSNIFPLMMSTSSVISKTDRVIEYLKKEKVLEFPGGIPSSMEHSGEQWDFPNAWAPHVHWFIESLKSTGNPEAVQIAEETAAKWVTNNYETYVNNNNSMFEKYDVQNVGSSGGGGEYEVVVGFGWTNGVVLDLLHQYGQVLSSGREEGESTTTTPETNPTTTPETNPTTTPETSPTTTPETSPTSTPSDESTTETSAMPQPAASTTEDSGAEVQMFTMPLMLFGLVVTFLNARRR